MSPTLTTIPPEILDKIIKEIASPRTSKSPLARRSTVGDRCLGDLSRNDSASATLSSLSQTCKVLRTHCLPHIFITASVRSSDGVSKLKSCLEQSEIMANLAQKNARTFSVCVEFRLFRDVSWIHPNWDDNKNTQKRVADLGLIVRCFPSVTALHLTNVLMGPGIIRMLTQIKTLRSLSLEVVYSGSKISKLESPNQLCRGEDDWLELYPGEVLPPLESLHFSPPLLHYSYDDLVSAPALRNSLRELSFHRSTASLDWTHYLVSGVDEHVFNSDLDYFPCLERLSIQRTNLILAHRVYPIVPFLCRHRGTLREFTIQPRDPYFIIPMSALLHLIHFMTGEDIDIFDLHERPRDKEEMQVDGFSAVFGDWLAASIDGTHSQRPVLELGISLGQSLMVLDTEYDFPLSDLGALLGPQCFDEVEVIAFDTVYEHTFFFSEFITQLENICATRFTKLNDISISWDARDTRWSRSEPRRFTELPSTSNKDCKFDEEWVSANYSIAESFISSLFRSTAIERLELVPVFDILIIDQRTRPDNFPTFKSWVWQKSQCGTKVHGTLWKRPNRTPFIAVGVGSEREAESYWVEPVIDENESDELPERESDEDESDEDESDENEGDEDEGDEEESDEDGIDEDEGIEGESNDDESNEDENEEIHESELDAD